MRFKTLQIVWHERQPIFAIEFLSDGVVATGGADKVIRVDFYALTQSCTHELRVLDVECKSRDSDDVFV